MGNSHELIIEDPKKVTGALDLILDDLKALTKVVETTSDIGNMGLAIAGLDKTFTSFKALEPTLKDAEKTVTDIKEAVELAVKKFAEMNEDITI